MFCALTALKGHVAVFYSQCTTHLASGWRTDIDAEWAALQAEIRRKILKEENQADYVVLLITQGQLANAGLRRFPGEPALANLSDGP